MSTPPLEALTGRLESTPNSPSAAGSPSVTTVAMLMSRARLAESSREATPEATGASLEGNYCYLHLAELDRLTPPDPRRGWKREYLRRSIGDAARILEIGFNAGHSAALIGLESKEIHITCVDIGEHVYSKSCAEVMSKTFGERFEMLWGDSRHLLVSDGGLEASACDLVHIDGGHGSEVFRHDLEWWIRTARPGARLLVDDAYVPSIKDPLDDLLEAGRIEPETPGLVSSGENRLFVKSRL